MLFFNFMYFIYFQDDSHGFFSKNGMIMNIIGLAYGCGILTTIILCKLP